MKKMGRCLVLLPMIIYLAVLFSFPVAIIGAEGKEEWCPDEPSASAPGIIEGGTGTGGTQATIDDLLSLPKCGANEVRDSTGACVCAPGQERVGGLCTPLCGPGEVREDATGKCICAGGYERVGDQCVAKCAEDEERIDLLCVARCGANEERNTLGVCICREGFESVDGLCYQRCGLNEHHDEKGQCSCTEGFERVGDTCLVLCGAYETRAAQGGCICLSGYQRLKDGSCGRAEDRGFFRAEEEVSGEKAEEVASEPVAAVASGTFSAEEELSGESAVQKAISPALRQKDHFMAEGEIAGENADRRAGLAPSRQVREDSRRKEPSRERSAVGSERSLRERSSGDPQEGDTKRGGDVSKQLRGASPGSVMTIGGAWNSNIHFSYSIEQNKNRFRWRVTAPADINEVGEGIIEGDTISASWRGTNGSGTAEGKLQQVDASGRVTRIIWNNGVIFTR